MAALEPVVDALGTGATLRFRIRALARATD
jgi:hypothetical protein